MQKNEHLNKILDSANEEKDRVKLMHTKELDVRDFVYCDISLKWNLIIQKN